MYAIGQAGSQRDETLTQPPPPIEPISSVHQNTIGILGDANNALSQVLAKVRGNQPEPMNNKLEKMPERFILADARTIRDLAGQIFEKVNDLHRYIGHDK
jgi:hypothetical protein